jgi:hypothetical protein
MNTRFLGAVAASLFATGAFAQNSDPMALQRCIWSCLARSPGAASLEYNLCVERFCATETALSGIPSSGVPWDFGIASDGITRFAGLQLPGGQGEGVYFMCSPRSLPYLMLFAFDRPEGAYRLNIDGREFVLPFDRSRGQLTVSLRPNAQILDILAQGSWLSVTDPQGYTAASLSLSGAARAIATAQIQCRNG